jgi:uncharacterized protein YyaL (SSP411 family)
LSSSFRCCSPCRPAAPIDNRDGFWNEWSDAIFAKAASEKKFVVVSLEFLWCRWCHVMNAKLGECRGARRPQGQVHPCLRRSGLRGPHLATYERWGWPATIIFAPDGTES